MSCRTVCDQMFRDASSAAGDPCPRRARVAASGWAVAMITPDRPGPGDWGTG